MCDKFINEIVSSKVSLCEIISLNDTEQGFKEYDILVSEISNDEKLPV